MAELVARLIGFFVFRPLVVVTRLMRPRTARDEHIESLQATRAWLGFVGLVALLVANQRDKDFAGTVQSFGQAPLFKAAVALPSFLVAGVVLVALTQPGFRRLMTFTVIKPWLTAIAIRVVPIGLFLLGAYRFRALGRVPAGDQALWFTIFILFIAPLLPAVVWAQILAVRHSFRACDVHPFMPALVGCGIAGVSIVKGGFDIAGGGTTLDRNLGWFSMGGGIVVATL